jgi:hypothetical protein
MKAKQTTLHARVMPDLCTAEIGLGPAKSPNETAQLNADQVDSLMAGLADIRQQMMPEVPDHFPQGKPTHRHAATKFSFGIDAISGQPLLSFRSPGFGWMSFVLPFAEAEKLGVLLQAARGHAKSMLNMDKPN